MTILQPQSFEQKENQPKSSHADIPTFWNLLQYEKNIFSFIIIVRCPISQQTQMEELGTSAVRSHGSTEECRQQLCGSEFSPKDGQLVGLGVDMDPWSPDIRPTELQARVLQKSFPTLRAVKPLVSGTPDISSKPLGLCRPTWTCVYLHGLVFLACDWQLNLYMYIYIYTHIPICIDVSAYVHVCNVYMHVYEYTHVHIDMY